MHCATGSVEGVISQVSGHLHPSPQGRMPHSRSWQPLARRLQDRRSSCVAIRYSRWLPFLSWTFNQSWVCSVQRSCLEQVAEGAAGLSPGGDGGHGYCQALASPVRLCRRLEVAAVGAEAWLHFNPSKIFTSFGSSTSFSMDMTSYPFMTATASSKSAPSAA